MRRVKGLVTAIAVCLLLAAANVHADSILNLGVPTGTYGETQASTTSGTINGAVFMIGGQQPAGSGVLDSFLRVHSNGNATYEHGYNTDGGTPLDDVGGSFTHSIQLSDLHTSYIGGQSYYGFVLDINQDASLPDPYLSLVSFKIFQAGSGSLTSFDTTTELFPSTDATLTYDMRAAGSARVDLNYLVSSSGSGNADAFVYIPTALFSGGGKYVYLYSAFGGNGTYPPYSQTDGYEEWATASSGGSPAPLPNVAYAGLLLMGGVLVMRRRSRPAGAPLA